MSQSEPAAASSDSSKVELQTGSVDPQSIEGLFLAALQKGPQEREAFLEAACRNDAERRRVAALLLAYDDAGSFLESPAGGARSSGEADEIRLDFLSPSEKPGCLGTIGPYEVVDVIGRGGMGIVLRALDPKLNRIVAVKVLAPELAANPNARRRFIREAQAAASISHPHVVTIHAVEEGHTSSVGWAVPTTSGGHSPPYSALGSSLPYLVMECVVGQSLQQKLDRHGSLRLTEVLRIGHQVASGLAAAHKQGLIHRDIKPANILLENGIERVKITDFGLARLVDDVAITRTGEVTGTPQYMSPEQARGEKTDHRSDLFSLGCVLYAMCTGHSPFRGDSFAHVIKRVTQDEPRPIEEQNPGVPRWLCDMISRLLEKEPAARFQSTDEVVDRLGEHLAGWIAQVDNSSVSVVRSCEDGWKPTPPAILNLTGDPRVGRLRTAGRRVLQFALIALGAPWILVWIGLTGVGDGDVMEFGGQLFAALLPFGLIALAVGGTMWIAAWIMNGSKSPRGVGGEQPVPQPVSAGRSRQASFLAVPDRLSGLVIAIPVGFAAVFLAMTLARQTGVALKGGSLVGRPISAEWSIGVASLAALITAWLILRGDRARRNQKSDARPKPAASSRSRLRKVLAWSLALLLVGAGIAGVVSDVTSLVSFSPTGTLVFTYPPEIDVREVQIDGRRVITVHSSNEVRVPRLSKGTHEVEVSYRHLDGTHATFKSIVSIPWGGEKSLALTLEPGPREEPRQRSGKSAGPPGFSMARADDRPQEETTASLPPFGGASEKAASQVQRLPPFPKALQASAQSLPPGIRWSVDKSYSSVWQDGTVQLNVRLLSEDLLVGLRRKSLFDRTISPEEKVVTMLGDSTVRVQPGDYQVIVRDERFGWLDSARHGVIPVKEFGTGTLEIERGFRRLTSDGGEFPEVFVWDGVRYRVPQEVSFIIDGLFESWIDGTPEVPEQSLLAQSPGEMMSGRVAAESLEAVFQERAHRELWGKLVVPGKETGTYRLAPFPEGKIHINLAPKFFVGVRFPLRSDPQKRTGSLEEVRFATAGAHDLSARPGDYQFVVYDSQVKWLANFGSSDGPGYMEMPTRIETRSLADGMNMGVDVIRLWTDYAKLPDRPLHSKKERDATQEEREAPRADYRLVWFDRGQNGPPVSISGFADPNAQGFSMSAEAASFVATLFQGLADGQPDVNYTGEKSIEDLFPGRANGDWEELIIPGEVAETWRLNVPEEAKQDTALPPVESTPSLAEDAPGPGAASAAPTTSEASKNPDEPSRPGTGGIATSTVPTDLPEIGKTTTPAPSETIAANSLPAGVTWRTQDARYVNDDGKVSIVVGIRNHGMLVALRRKSEFDGKISSEESLARTFGNNFLTLPPGDYEVLIRDEQFGFDIDRRAVIPAKDKHGWMTVQRDLGAVAGGRGQRKSNAFRWNGKTYRLRGFPQDRAIAVLGEAYASGNPDVAEAVVLAAAQESGAKFDSVEAVFTEADGSQSPAWGELIVKGAHPGEYRLAPFPQGTLALDMPDRDLYVMVYPLGPEGRQGADRMDFGQIGSYRVPVAPGKFRVAIDDSQVGWSHRPSAARTEEVEVGDGKITRYIANRRWADYSKVPAARASPPVSFPAYGNASCPYWLRWFGRQVKAADTVAEKRIVEDKNDATIPLNREAAEFIGTLFQGLADGQPEVKYTGEKPIEELFPDLAGGDWKVLIVPGEAAGTWRLNVPEESKSEWVLPNPPSERVPEL